MRRIPELDGLRGTAILLVLMWHFAPDLFSNAPSRLLHAVNSINRFSFSGVDLFFVLSGFLIGGILLDNRESPRYFGTFYARRVHRILPIYVVLVGTFTILLHTRVPRGMEWLFERPMPLWSYVTFTQNLAMARAYAFGAQWTGPTWSLAVEEQFYLLLPPVIHLLPRRRLGLAFVVLALAAPVTRAVLVLFDPHWGLSAYILMPSRADALMLGVLAAWMLRDERWRQRILAGRPVLYRALAALAVAGVVMALMHETVGSVRMVLYGYTVLALFYAAVLLLAVTAREDEMLGVVLRVPVLRKIGTLAYGVYLFHLPVFGVVALFVPGPVLRTTLSLAATFAIAAASWTYFEQPFIRRGRRYSY